MDFWNEQGTPDSESLHFAIDPDHTIKVKKIHVQHAMIVGGFVAFILFIVLILLGIWWIGYDNTVSLNYTFEKVKNNYQVLPQITNKEECLSCQKRTFEEGICRCKNGYYGQYCQSQYGGEFMYLGLGKLAGDPPIPLKNISVLDRAVNSSSCEQFCNSTPNCESYNWKDNIECGKGTCTLYGKLTADRDTSFTHYLDNGYYVKNFNAIEFKNKIFVSRFNTPFFKKFWEMKDNNYFASLMANQYKMIPFLPNFRKIPHNYIGIYSDVPFDYFNYQEIINAGDNDHIRIVMGNNEINFPTSWTNLKQFYVYFAEQ